MDTKVLEEIGFTRGEIKVYLALIELGESTIGPISKKSMITPAKVYPILEKLKLKGLITSVIKSGTNYFQAFKPDRILNYLDEKEKRISAQKEEIKEFIPQLIAQQKKEAQQYAAVYESFNGIKTLYKEILECLKEKNEDFIAFTLGNEFQNEQANIFFKNYGAKRRSMGIKTRLIALQHQKKFLKKEYGKDKNIDIRYLKHAIPTGLIIFDDKVATLLWGDIPTAFVIHSKQNANVYRKFFDDMWKIAK